MAPPLKSYLVLTVFLAGCSPERATVPIDAVPNSATLSKPLALRGGERISMDQVEVTLLEMAGGAAIREVVLNNAVDREAARRGMALNEATLDRERSAMREMLSPTADRSELLLREIRLRDGLGPARFGAMLRRSALLRAMIQKDVALSEEIVRAVWDAAHGPRRSSRILAVDDLAQATAALDRMNRGEAFADVAIEVSLDPSAPQGGLMPPVSRHDPAWPEAFRRAVFEVPLGSISPPIAIDGRFLLLQALTDEPASGRTFEEGRAEAERSARLAQERVLMNRLARQLLGAESTTVLDPAVRWREDF